MIKRIKGGYIVLYNYVHKAYSMREKILGFANLRSTSNPILVFPFFLLFSVESLSLLLMQLLLSYFAAKATAPNPRRTKKKKKGPSRQEPTHGKMRAAASIIQKVSSTESELLLQL